MKNLLPTFNIKGTQTGRFESGAMASVPKQTPLEYFQTVYGGAAVTKLSQWREKGFTRKQALYWHKKGYDTPEAALRSIAKRKKVFDEYERLKTHYGVE